ncbi:hypothetical protein BZA70DRAFT_58365 [Myxozyma melibiosi]|uniref:NAD-dependent epimerase/dehydratase domain-containing protein n=1 Tax=Myxozyma melibiosi TaxID=54550 RepID=A0ABR1F1J8_9ASCO
MSPKLLLTGATGYVGGHVLAHLVAFNSPSKLDLSAFVRKQSDADKLVSVYGSNVSVVLGPNAYEDPAFASAVAEADIVLHLGNAADDPVSADLIAAKIKDGALLIHISGSFVLSDFSKLDQALTTPVDDIKDIKTITSLPESQPHRDIDIKVLDLSKKRPNVKTLIVCPPLIYGPSKSIGHKASIQIPLLIKIASIAKANKVFGTGNAIWSTVHLSDLANFFVTLVSTYISDPSKLSYNDEGYYFVASEQRSWGEIVAALDAPLVHYGVIPSENVSSKEPAWTADSFTILGDKSSYVYSLFTSNSVTEPSRAKKLGWKPVNAGLLAEIGPMVKLFSDGVE